MAHLYRWWPDIVAATRLEMQGPKAIQIWLGLHARRVWLKGVKPKLTYVPEPQSTLPYIGQDHLKTGQKLITRYYGR